MGKDCKLLHQAQVEPCQRDRRNRRDSTLPCSVWRQHGTAAGVKKGALSFHHHSTSLIVKKNIYIYIFGDRRAGQALPWQYFSEGRSHCFWQKQLAISTLLCLVHSSEKTRTEMVWKMEIPRRLGGCRCHVASS